MVRAFWLISLVIVGCGPTLAEDSWAEGPWTIAASIEGYCVMSTATPNGVEAIIERGEDGLTLKLTSARWTLSEGVEYPVKFVADRWNWETAVKASASSVEVAITGVPFLEGIRRGRVLEIQGEGATLKVPLDRSSAALRRLERCFDLNWGAAIRNPFVASE